MGKDLQNQQFEVLLTVNEYIKRLIIGIEQNIVLIRGSGIDECGDNLADIFDGLQWIYDALKLTSSVQSEEIDIEEIDGFLEEMLEAFQNEDFILMSDLFEYEILPILNKWDGIIDSSIKC